MRKNRVIGYSGREERATKKNRIAKRSNKKEGIEDVNGNISKVSFFDQRITKYNWQKKKKTRL